MLGIKSENHWHFQIKKFCFISELLWNVAVVVIIGAKGYCRDDCFDEGFVYNRNFNNCAALLSENCNKLPKR